MPGDLSNPETSAFPTYYDKKYDQAPNQFDSGSPDTRGYIQSIIFENLHRKLDEESLKNVEREAEGKGLFHLNEGDEDFRSGILKIVKNLKMARRVVKNAGQQQ